MKSWQTADCVHLSAAHGWLDLGSYPEAVSELEALSSELRTDPEVLKAYWEICAAGGNWEAALGMAETLVQANDLDPFGWVYRSRALWELGRRVEARDNMSQAVVRFPANAILCYNLAYYACQLGQLDEARRWLQAALERGNEANIQQAALLDPGLKPMWKQICGLETEPSSLCWQTLN